MFLRMTLRGGKFIQKQRAIHQSFRQREIPGDGQDVNNNTELVIPSTLTKITQAVYKTSGPHKEKFPNDQFD